MSGESLYIAALIYALGEVLLDNLAQRPWLTCAVLVCAWAAGAAAWCWLERKGWAGACFAMVAAAAYGFAAAVAT